MFERLFVKDIDEATLIQQAQTNQRAFARLYDSYVDVVFRFVRRRVQNDQDAEDIVSETFMALASRIQDYDAKQGSFKTWLLSIANYKYLDKMRQVYRDSELPLSDDYDPGYEQDFAQLLTDKLLYQQIIDIVHSLSDRQSTIFFLRHIEELPNNEIAKICEVDERTISSTLSIVAKKIKKRINTQV